MKSRSATTGRWYLRRLVRPAQRLLVRHLYQDRNRRLDHSILVAGTARSGTTWLGDLLAGSRGRILFEPFHRDKVQKISNLPYIPYARPHEEDPQLLAFARQVFSGAVRHPWIDREAGPLRPRFRVVKDIRANLLLKWLRAHFPEVPQVLIVRHPCAVALSRRQLHWATDDDIASFLAQPALIEDHLAPYMEAMQRARTPLEKHAIIWCVSYLVPWRQFAPGELQVVFYEDLCRNPEHELERLAARLNWRFARCKPEAPHRPSSTAIATSAVLTGNSRVSHWQKALAAGEVAQVLDTVAAFGLDHLYGSSPLPQARTFGGA